MKWDVLKKLVVLFITALFFVNVSGQKILLAESSGKLYSLDLTSGNCVTQQVSLPNNCTAQFFSIALFKDTLYYTSNGGLYRAVLNNPSPCKFLLNVPSNALTVDGDGMLYWQYGFDLVKYDPHTGTSVTLAKLSYLSAGDLVFYKDKLLMAAVEGIVEIDLHAQPVTDTLIMPTPGRAFYGLFSLPVDCNTNKVYALESSTTSKVVEFDLENRTILNTYCILPFIVNDAASITESGITQGITVSSIDIKQQCGINGKGSININAASATANVTLQYTLNNTTTNGDGNFPALAGGTYAIHISSTDGCTKDTVVTVKTVDEISVNLISTPDTCEAKKGSLFVQKITGTEPFVFLLDNTISQVSPSFNGLSTGAHILKVTDRNTCLLDTGFAIQSFSPTLPISSITITPPTCTAGGTVKLVYLPSANVTGAKLDGGNFAAVDNFSNIPAGPHFLQIMNGSCVFDTTITVPGNTSSPPLVSFTNESPDCTGNTGTSSIHISNILKPFSVSFNAGDYSSVTNFTGLAAGIYPFKIKDANGCVWDMTDTIPAFVAVKPLVQTNIINAECWQGQPGKVRLSMSGPGSPYQFDLNGTRYITGQQVQLAAGNYIARIFTATNCPVDSLAIIIKQQNSFGANCDTIYVPSAFTPNGDGVNDVSKPTVSLGTQSFTFRIYNRWGQVLFETRTAGEGWNGKWKSMQQSSGTYVWIMECRDSAGEKKIYNGTFVLIR